MDASIELTDEQVKQLLRDDEIIKKINDERPRRSQYHQRWSQWLNIESLGQISDEELKKRFLEYYETGAGRHRFNMLFRDRIIRDVGKFRRMLLFLFDESTDLKSRINETLESDGKYKIEGVGKNLVTSFLFDFNPQEYCIWNNKVQAGLEKIGWPVERKGTRGDRYLRILEHLKRLRSLAPEGYANFDDLDYFLHIIAVEPEGERALDRILTGRIPVRVSEEFDIMEKTLSDFLERNFSKIFPRLRIYEDEEGKGVEYTTGVGRIDILATDEEANIVIMELKGGIARHDSLSQVLSYMQWVQENIAAEGKKVKGVIVAQDADDKLRFALKRVKDVDFYRFRVRFELEKT